MIEYKCYHVDALNLTMGVVDVVIVLVLLLVLMAVIVNVVVVVEL